MKKIAKLYEKAMDFVACRSERIVTALIGVTTLLQIPIVIWCLKEVNAKHAIIHTLLGLLGLALFVYAIHNIRNSK